MSNSKKTISYILPVTIILIFIFIFIFQPEVKLGINNGLNIWSKILIPNLLPFIFLSGIISKLDMGEKIAKLFHPFFHFLFKTDIYGSYAMTVGFLCGYPIGAKIINDLISSKKISASEANRLLFLCNNPSPGFLISYLCLSLFETSPFRYIIIYFLTLIIYNFFYIKVHSSILSNHTPAASTTAQLSHQPFICIINDSINDSFFILLKLSGYLIFFTIFATIISSLTFINEWISFPIIILSEMSYACYYVSLYNFSNNFKTVLCFCISIFGGFSTILQTKSLCPSKEISIKSYILNRFNIAILYACINIMSLWQKIF